MTGTARYYVLDPADPTPVQQRWYYLGQRAQSGNRAAAREMTELLPRLLAETGPTQQEANMPLISKPTTIDQTRQINYLLDAMTVHLGDAQHVAGSMDAALTYDLQCALVGAQQAIARAQRELHAISQVQALEAGAVKLQPAIVVE